MGPPDTTNTDPAYWEKVLRSHNLSVNRGAHPQTKIRYNDGEIEKVDVVLSVGGLNNLVGVEEQEYRIASGKVKPSGHGPDK